MTVTILRQHYQYELVSSQVYKTTIISTIKCDGSGPELFFIPSEEILEDLEIRDEEGRHLTVLSDKELSQEFGIDKRAIFAKNAALDVVLDDKLDLIPVLLQPAKSQYRKIFFSHTTSVEGDRYAKTKFSPDMSINFRFKILPYEYLLSGELPTENSFDIHIMFKINDNYRINKGERIRLYADDRDIASTSSNEHSRSWFVPNVKFDDVIVGDINIGLAYSLLNSARAIAIISALAPLFLVAVQIHYQKLFLPTLELIGGALALLIGSQFWILKDNYLMTRWRGLQMYLIVLNGILFVLWFIVWTNVDWQGL